MSAIVYSDPAFPMTLKQLHRIEEVSGAKLPKETCDYLISLPGTRPSRSLLRCGTRVYTEFTFGSHWSYPEGRLIVTPESKCFGVCGAKKRALFCVELNDYDYGAIYLWEGGRGQPLQSLGRVADDLLGLVDMLEDDPNSDFWEFYNKQRNLDGPQWAIDTYHDFEDYFPTYDDQLRLTDPDRLIQLDLKNSGPGVSCEYLDWVELAFRIRLPLDIRRFYSKQNGGYPTETMIEHDGRKVHVNFYSWEKPTSNIIPRWTEGEFAEYIKIYKYDAHIYPAHHWPLGMTSLPEQNLSFCTGKDHYGSIWLHAETPDKRPVKIANSFAQFVSCKWQVT